MLSPSIDSILQVGSLTPGSVQSVLSETSLPGGKGLNVARMLAHCGASVGLTGLIGQGQQSYFQATCRAAGIDDRLHAIQAATRSNLTLVDNHSELKINRPAFAGYQLPPPLRQTLLDDLASGEVAILTGSLPADMPPDTYQHLITALHDRHIICVLDAAGAALAAGLRAAPAIIKPNLAEAAELVGHALDDAGAIIAAARQLAQRHDVVILSTGVDGAWFASERLLYHATAPSGHTQDTTGAGDVMLAQFCVDYFQNGRTLTPELMARTVAAGTAATEQHGAAPPSPARITALTPDVTITPHHHPH